MKIITFKVTPGESETILAIVKRAEKLGLVKRGGGYDFVTATMDITAAHANGNPLDLKALLTADDFNFTHDVAGIARHINRSTGQLDDYFVPRFTSLKSKAEKV